MVLFESPRLRMRRFTLEDAAQAHRFHGDDEVMRSIGDGRVWSSGPEDTTALRKIIAHYERGPLGFWAVEEKASGELIGHCLLLNLPEADAVEVGWLLAREAWGQGYGYEMARATVDYAFGELDLPRLVAIAQADNAASTAIMHKLGMHRIGNLTHYGKPVVCYELHRKDIA